MTLSPDDPKLTAYVLGELDDAERAEIQSAIEQSPPLQQAVAGIRSVTEALATRLHSEFVPELDDARRTALNDALSARSAAPAGADIPTSPISTGSATAAPALHPWLPASAPSGAGRAANFSSRGGSNSDKYATAQYASDANPSPLQGEGRVRVRPLGNYRRLLVPLSLAASVAMVFAVSYEMFDPGLSRARGVARKSVATGSRDDAGERFREFSKSKEASVRQFIAPSSSEYVAADSVSRNSDVRAARAKKMPVAAPGDGRLRTEPPGAPMTEEAKQQLAANQGKPISAAFEDDGGGYPGSAADAASNAYALAFDAASVPAPSNPRRGRPSRTEPPGNPMAEFGAGVDARFPRSQDLSPMQLHFQQQQPQPIASLGYVAAGQVQANSPQHLRISGDPRLWQLGQATASADGFFPHSITTDWNELDPEWLAKIPPELLAEMRAQENLSGDAYSPVSENPYLEVLRTPLSTFSIDVDTASYSNVRRFLQAGTLPPRDAVRIEELINYFDYDYPLPTDEHPFSVNVEVSQCPWAPQHRLARIGIKGMEFSDRDRPAANLVFLIDVSGSMQQPNKLPLVKESLGLLVDSLRRQDSVAIVVYAAATGLVLPATSGGNRAAILDAIDRLSAGGSTCGSAGIQLAYDTAIQNFIEGGVNRVILATDGDFNVGVQNREELQRLIEEKAKSGVFLSVLGYGMGNLKDATLEMLADKGNGNYAYIDTISEAEKVLVDQMGGTLVTIAKDVKIQVEFNPAEVHSYRLIGYENRMLAAQDFNDDRKDAGEIGAGHTVTALYEIVPAGLAPPDDAPAIDPLKYQYAEGEVRNSKFEVRRDDDDGPDNGDDNVPSPSQGEGRGEGEIQQDSVADVDGESLPLLVPPARGDGPNFTPAAHSGELMTVKLRYKEPDEEVSKLIEVPVIDSGAAFEESSDDFAFAAAVASFGMLLRQSSYTKAFGASPQDAIDLFDYDFVREVAGDARGADPYGYRAEFLQLVEKAKTLSAAAP